MLEIKAPILLLFLTAPFSAIYLHNHFHRSAYVVNKLSLISTLNNLTLNNWYHLDSSVTPFPCPSALSLPHSSVPHIPGPLDFLRPHTVGLPVRLDIWQVRSFLLVCYHFGRFSVAKSVIIEVT
jgi:hypothetical protein